MKKAGISLGSLLFFFSLGFTLFAPLSNAQAYHIAGCGQLNESGYYILDNDINVTQDVCFSFGQGISNITVDLNGHTIHMTKANAYIFRGVYDSNVIANVTIINGTIKVYSGHYVYFTNKSNMYIEDINLTSDGTCCPSFVVNGRVEIHNINMVTTSTESLNIIVDSSYEPFLVDSINVYGNGSGSIQYYSYNYLSNITNCNVQHVSGSGKVYLENVSVDNVYFDIDYLSFVYFENLTVRGEPAIYCDGCVGDYTGNFILVKNGNINFQADQAESSVFAYNSIVNVTGDYSTSLTHYIGYINATGQISNIQLKNVTGVLNLTINESSINVYDLGDLDIYQTKAFLYLYCTQYGITVDVFGSELKFADISGASGGVCNISYNRNFTSAYLDPSLDTYHRIYGITIGSTVDIGSSFKRYVYEISSEKVVFVDDFESGRHVDYTIYNLKPNTTYNVYLNGTLTYVMTSSPDGTLGPFNVTFSSPVNITLEEFTPSPYLSITFNYSSIDFGNVYPYNSYAIEGLAVNVSTNTNYSVYISGTNFSAEWAINTLNLTICYDAYSLTKSFSETETLFDAFPALNATHYHKYTLYVPLVPVGNYSTAVVIDYRV